MKRKSLTLAEIMISVFIIAVGVGAIFTVYPPLFEGVEVTFQTMRAWGGCRKEIEILKNTDFATLWTQAAIPGSPNPQIFAINLPNMSGVYYVDKIYDTTISAYLTDALMITVVVSAKAKNRVVGEDQNLNGLLDGAEDTNNNAVLDSPISLTTMVIKQ
jgi:hypothetical protein